MAAQGLPRVALVVKARPDDVDPGVFVALRRLGLVRVFLGVETDAPAGQRALGRRLAPDANRRALSHLVSTGVFVCSNLLLWEPDTTLDDLRANVALMRDFPDVLFNLARTEPYEGAPLTERLARQGRLLGDYRARDYLVADPRAELAWRLFAVALADRCYPFDGAINLAMGLAHSVRLLDRLAPSERAGRLCAEGLALARRVALSTREWLELLVDYASAAPTGPAPEVLQFALDVGRAVRTEDTALRAETRALLGRMESCARGRPEEVFVEDLGETPSPRRRAKPPLSSWPAGVLACASQRPRPPGPSSGRRGCRMPWRRSRRAARRATAGLSRRQAAAAADASMRGRSPGGSRRKEPLGRRGGGDGRAGCRRRRSVPRRRAMSRFERWPSAATTTGAAMLRIPAGGEVHAPGPSDRRGRRRGLRSLRGHRGDGGAD